MRESSRAVVAFWFALFCLFCASVAYFDSAFLVFFFLVAGSAREDENYNCVKNKLIFLVAVAAFLCVSCLADGNYVLFADACIAVFRAVAFVVAQDSRAGVHQAWLALDCQCSSGVVTVG